MEDREYKDFAERLKNEAQAKGLTQKELAQKCGVTEACMSRYFSGNRVPKATTIVKIAEILNVTVDYLIGEKNTDYTYEKICEIVKSNLKNMTIGQKVDLIELILEAERGESKNGR